ncbi:MAG: hypothetical protein ACI9G1_005395, partial [Pirellulaceae bacterium]
MKKQTALVHLLAISTLVIPTLLIPAMGGIISA